MKYLLLPIFAALVLTSGFLRAQAPTNSGLQQVEDPALVEMRIVASSLKELYGDLNNQLNAVSKLSETTDRIAAKRFVEIQSDIKADISKVEGALTSMSGMEPQAWAASKEEFVLLEKEMRTSVSARTKGLSEAYGDK